MRSSQLCDEKQLEIAHKPVMRLMLIHCRKISQYITVSAWADETRPSSQHLSRETILCSEDHWVPNSKCGYDEIIGEIQPCAKSSCLGCSPLGELNTYFPVRRLEKLQQPSGASGKIGQLALVVIQ